MALEDASSVILDAGKSSPHMNQGVKLTVMFLSERHPPFIATIWGNQPLL